MAEPAEKKTVEQYAAEISEKQTALTDAISKKADQTEIDGLKSTIDALKEGQVQRKEIDDLKAIVDSLDEGAETKHKLIERLEKMEADATDAAVRVEKALKLGAPNEVTIKSLVEGALASPEWKDYTERGFSGNSKAINLNLKDVTYGGYTGDVVEPTRKPGGPKFQPDRRFDVRDVVPTTTTAKDTHSFLRETGYTDGSGVLAETAASGESTFSAEEIQVGSVRIAAHIDVSNTNLDNTDWLVPHLTQRMTKKLGLQYNTQVLTGSGAANNMNGLMTQASTVSVGSFASSIQSAGIADALIVSKYRLAEVTNMVANVAFMNPTDVGKMLLAKDTQDRYINDVIIRRDEMGIARVNGLPIAETYDIPVGEFLIAEIDNDTVELLFTKQITMKAADQHGTNAVENMTTFIFESRAILAVYQTYSLMKGVFATVQAAINV